MCTRRIVLLGFLLFMGAAAYAQQYAYQVNFTNKNGTLSLNNPLAFLSQRALNRRQAQGIAVDSSDLPISPAYIDSAVTLTGGVLHVTSRWLNFCVLLLGDSSQIAHIRNKPYVSSVQLVGYYATDLHNRMVQNTGTSAPAYRHAATKTTGSAAYYGDTYIQTALVNGDYLHDNGFKGQGKLIAILDAGFIGSDTNSGFDSLRTANGIVETFDLVHKTSNVYDYDDHGTSVLSTMAGNLPGTYVGSAPQARYALYITEAAGENPVELDNMIAGVERADSLGADVISVSLGYDLFDNPDYNFHFATDFDGKTTVAAKAANIATSKGILFVASAGNEGATVPGWGNYILTPGDADSALTIGAVDQNGNPASFSGYGPNAAGQIKPDVCGYGIAVPVFSGNGVIVSEDGTSFATPEIAGFATCLWQANAAAKPYMLRQAIDQSANHYDDPGVQLGYGVPDFRRALQILDVKDTPMPGSAWVSAYPNPFTNDLFVSVRVSHAQTLAFRLTDVAGREMGTASYSVATGYTPDIPLTFSGLATGIYFLKVMGADGQQVLKLEKH